MSQCDANRFVRRSIYIIEGPTGIYVGCTCQPVERRIARHFWQAQSGRSNWPLYRAMRAHPRSTFRIRVVAESRTFRDGLATEDAVVFQFAREGARVLNYVAHTRLAPEQHRALWLRWLTEADCAAICRDFGISASTLTALCPVRAVIPGKSRGRRLRAEARALGATELMRRIDAALQSRAAQRGTA